MDTDKTGVKGLFLSVCIGFHPSASVFLEKP